MPRPATAARKTQPLKMAPPAVKRRKLSHDSDEHSSDGAIGPRFAAKDTASSDDDDQSDVSAADVDMDAVSHDEDEDGSEQEDDDESEGGEETSARQAQAKSSEKKKTQNSQKEVRRGPLRDRDMAELTGAYTGEVYKSNMFKLQVDELLDQIRPKHGKKEAAAEKALRELKVIIENIPAREPSSVSHSLLLFCVKHMAMFYVA